MSQALRRGFGLLAALLIGTGVARAQQPPAERPSTQDFARQLDKDLKEAEEYDPSTGQLVRAFRSWLGLVILAVVLGCLAVVLHVGVWVFRRMSATTDPHKLAMSDPWVRAHLARQNAEGWSPPPIDRPEP